jgi:hypothetical protein
MFQRCDVVLREFDARFDVVLREFDARFDRNSTLHLLTGALGSETTTRADAREAATLVELGYTRRHAGRGHLRHTGNDDGAGVQQCNHREGRWRRDGRRRAHGWRGHWWRRSARRFRRVELGR